MWHTEPRLQPHAPGQVTPGPDLGVVFVEDDAHGLWLFDPERMQFQWLPTPDGGRVLDVESVRSRSDSGAEEASAIESRSLVRGERAKYALVGNELVVDSVLEVAQPRPQATDSLGQVMPPSLLQDPIEFTVSFAATWPSLMMTIRSENVSISSGTGVVRTTVRLSSFAGDWAMAQVLPGPNIVNMALMIAGRREPALPTLRMRAAGELVELGLSDLGFSRDEIVDFVRVWAEKTELPRERFMRWIGVAKGKFYDWQKRYGKANEHTSHVSRDL